MKEPLYITFNDNKIKGTQEHNGFNVDFDKNRKAVGIEILKYKKLEINGEEIETNELSIEE